MLEKGTCANFLFQWCNKSKRKKLGNCHENRSEMKKKFELQERENKKRVPNQNPSKFFCGEQQILQFIKKKA